MRFPSGAPVTPQKLAALRERIERLGIDLAQVEETFIRAGGPGGQNVNKVSTGVQLRWPERAIVVKWTRERTQALNRFLALRELVDRVEMRDAPDADPRSAARARLRKQKDRRRRRRR